MISRLDLFVRNQVLRFSVFNIESQWTKSRINSAHIIVPNLLSFLIQSMYRVTRRVVLTSHKVKNL